MDRRKNPDDNRKGDQGVTPILSVGGSTHLLKSPKPQKNPKCLFRYPVKRWENEKGGKKNKVPKNTGPIRKTAPDHSSPHWGRKRAKNLP